MFKDNKWYSHRKILADYCNIKDRPAYASIQHGWFKLENNIVSDLKTSKIPNSKFLCWSDKIVNQYKKNNRKNVVAIGAPFIYLYDDIKLKFNVNKNILLFPPHTGEHEGSPSNFIKHNELISYVESKYNGPYSVCLFYQDMKEEIIKTYNKAKWNVVCCGLNRNDDNYLKNFINIVSNHDKILVCEMTSAYLYATYMKKDVIIIHDFSKDFTHRGFTGKERQESDWIYYEKYFPFFKNDVKFSIRFSEVKKELGCTSKKSKEEIKELLGWNSFTKKLGAFFINKYRKLEKNR